MNTEKSKDCIANKAKTVDYFLSLNPYAHSKKSKEKIRQIYYHWKVKAKLVIFLNTTYIYKLRWFKILPSLLKYLMRPYYFDTFMQVFRIWFDGRWSSIENLMLNVVFGNAFLKTRILRLKMTKIVSKTILKYLLSSNFVKLCWWNGI